MDVENDQDNRPMSRKIPGGLMILFMILLAVSGPVAIASFIWGGRMIGSIVTLTIILIYVSIYIYAMRRYG